MQVAVILRNTTLLALSEHTAKALGGSVPINENESAVLLSDQTLARLLTLARPGDERLDDVLLRLSR